MATRTEPRRLGELIVGKWQAGVGAGIAAIIPMIAYNMAVTGNTFPSLWGLIPYAVVWGFLYAGIASVDRVGRLADEPVPGIGVGIAYGFLVWMGPQIGEPIGQGVFTVNGAIQIVLFGAVLGLVYSLSPESA